VTGPTQLHSGLLWGAPWPLGRRSKCQIQEQRHSEQQRLLSQVSSSWKRWPLSVRSILGTMWASHTARRMVLTNRKMVTSGGTMGRG
jgi:hypothetical protein